MELLKSKNEISQHCGSTKYTVQNQIQQTEMPIWNKRLVFIAVNYTHIVNKSLCRNKSKQDTETTIDFFSHFAGNLWYLHWISFHWILSQAIKYCAITKWWLFWRSMIFIDFEWFLRKKTAELLWIHKNLCKMYTQVEILQNSDWSRNMESTV